MKRLTTISLALLSGILLTFGLASTVSARVSLETGNNSTDIALRDEELVINQFESAFVAYKANFGGMTSVVNEAELTQRAQAVETANAELQAKDFSPKLTAEFESAVSAFKATANDVTAVVAETANKDYSNEAQIDATAEALDTADASLDAAMKTLETTAAEYEAGSLAWVIFLAGGLVVALAIGITAVRAKKQNAALLARLTANDSNAQQLTSQQKKMIVRLYNDIVLYDQSLTRNNQAVFQGLEMGAYKQFGALADKTSFGSYAGLYYELDSLVKIRTGATEQAKESALKAAELRGVDALVTERARQLVKGPAN